MAIKEKQEEEKRLKNKDISLGLVLIIILEVMPINVWADSTDKLQNTELRSGDWNYVVEDEVACITKYTGEEHSISIPSKTLASSKDDASVIKNLALEYCVLTANMQILMKEYYTRREFFHER